MYDQFAWYGIYEERNKAATIPLSKRLPSESNTKIMNKMDHMIMDYRATKKIYSEIDSQINKNQYKKDPSIKKLNKTLLDEF